MSTLQGVQGHLHSKQLVKQAAAFNTLQASSGCMASDSGDACLMATIGSSTPELHLWNFGILGNFFGKLASHHDDTREAMVSLGDQKSCGSGKTGVFNCAHPCRTSQQIRLLMFRLCASMDRCRVMHCISLQLVIEPSFLTLCRLTLRHS